jgi:hypothetical protein
LVWSQQAAFLFEGWTAWWQCSYLFGVGDPPTGECTSLYYEGGEDREITKDAALALVEQGVISGATLIYSDAGPFHFEGWTPWEQCSYLFGAHVMPTAHK